MVLVWNVITSRHLNFSTWHHRRATSWPSTTWPRCMLLVQVWCAPATLLWRWGTLEMMLHSHPLKPGYPDNYFLLYLVIVHFGVLPVVFLYSLVLQVGKWSNLHVKTLETAKLKSLLHRPSFLVCHTVCLYLRCSFSRMSVSVVAGQSVSWRPTAALRRVRQTLHWSSICCWLSRATRWPRATWPSFWTRVRKKHDIRFMTGSSNAMNGIHFFFFFTLCCR